MTDLAALVSECGVNLYDTEIANDNGRTIFRVYITKNGGVNLDDCEAVSRLLSPIYDVMPPVSGDWVLEVSSPGIERKLSKIEHFKASIGELVKISLNDKSELKGKVLSATDDKITIDIDGVSNDINFIDIKKAKTYIEW
ncbi:ribosome maturation factor RimP [Campylobacter hyointestinalis]|uniref:Ribosome maturation factor RimP n=1 Tax=Campylobacter hyointestinalis TaxID=198 RepID=A0A562X9M3_CAMHY|nr:ribosome maturation factor RimP [Campylobacter hyointestinalis]RAZ49800.1 ribosome maturation factor RimP [Campylobacter hyointestinalis subsp. lawsonii]RAZ54850.1 ribosome maturation factor RimP [Campylobacter hyointestinalis subsp. lawsonii]RAZ63521.1 ribosome maturation factor RimP [Campylobacter hyointestinalis subsp. lawsonii]TWO18223.1 ribosome maturation factor RimP [Campylobacter hyointestinalis]